MKPNNYTQLYVQLVFAVKYREAVLSRNIRSRVFEYLSGILTGLKHKPIIILELSGEWTSRFNYKPYQVLVFLNELGYEMEEYDFQQWVAKPIK